MPRGLGDSPKLWLQEPPRAVCPQTTASDEAHAWFPLHDLKEEYLAPDWPRVPDGIHGPDYGAAEYYMIGDYIQAIRGNHDPTVDVYRALDFTLPGLASQASIELGGKPVQVPNFRAGNWG